MINLKCYSQRKNVLIYLEFLLKGTINVGTVTSNQNATNAIYDGLLAMSDIHCTFLQTLEKL